MKTIGVRKLGTKRAGSIRLTFLYKHYMAKLTLKWDFIP